MNSHCKSMIRTENGFDKGGLTLNYIERVPLTTCPFCRVALTKGTRPLCGKMFIRDNDGKIIVVRT